MLLQLVASWQGVAVTCLAAVLTVVLFVWRMLQRIRSRDLALLGFHDEYHSEHVERDRRFTIIAIHGLGSNPATTWSAKSGGTRIHWLKDPEFLPSKFPDATILTYNHNADWIYRASPTTARDCAQQLLQDILRWRAKHNSRAPMILMGHSYGGLVAKEVINITHTNHETYGRIRESIIGVIFLGTPHFGSATSKAGSFVAWLLSFFLGADGYLIRSMETHHPLLTSAHTDFVENCKAHVKRQWGRYDSNLDLWQHSKCFYERRPTMLIFDLLFSLGLTVDKLSASAAHPNSMPLDKDHSGMNKFARKDDKDYIDVCKAIEDLTDSPIAHRYRSEEQAFRIIDLIENNNLVTKNEPIFDDADLVRPVTINLFESKMYEQWVGYVTFPKPGVVSCLRLRLTRDAVLVPLIKCVLQRLHVFLQSYSHKDAPFGICFHSVIESGPGNSERAATVLQSIISQIIAKDIVDLPAADENIREKAHRILSSDPENSLQDPYWYLLFGLLRLEHKRRIVIAIDRLEAVHEEDRIKFLGSLKDLQLRFPNVPLLLSNSPNDAVDRALQHVTTFDATKDLQDAFKILKLKARNDHQRNVGQDILQNTGTWLQTHAQYKELLNTATSNILWLNGPAGSGKSTLIKAALDKFRSKHRSPSLAQMMKDEPYGRWSAQAESTKDAITTRRKVIVTSYFYHYDLGDSSEMSHKAMLISILFQIFWQHSDLLVTWLQRNKTAVDVDTWDFETLGSVFQNISSWTKGPLTIYIFLDAINESLPDIANENWGVPKSKIVELFCQLGTSSTACVTWKIMTASRDLDLPPEEAQFKCTIQIAEFNHDDAESVIRSKMAEIRAALRSRVSDNVNCEVALTEFHQKLRDGHNGIILWVKAVVELVKARMSERTFTLGDLVLLLRQPPPDLEKLYMAMVAQLKLRKRSMVDSIAESNNWLHWGVLASTHMSILEFKDAVAICSFDENESLSIEQLRIPWEEPQDFRTALALCGGGFLDLRQKAAGSHDTLSVAVDAMLDPDHKVQVAHESVKIFLTTAAATPFQIHAKAGHLFLARMCARYVTFTVLHGERTKEGLLTPDEAVEHLRKLPLLPYIFEHLPGHLEMLEKDHSTGQIEIDLQALCAAFENCNPQIASVLLVWARYQQTRAKNQQIWNDMMHAIEDKVPTAARNHQQNAENMLKRAASAGDPVALRSLFASGVLHQPTVNSQLRLEVLTYASHSIKSDWQVRAVVSKYMQDDLGKLESESGRILLRAVHDELPPDFIRDLVKNSRTLLYRDEAGLTALHLAVAKGLTETARILMEAGADPNSRDFFERTPLMNAVMSQQEHTSQLLLEWGVQIHDRDPEGNTAVSIASQRGHEGLVQLLTYFGAEPERVFVPKSPQSKGWMTVPLEQNPYFINRPELLKQLRTQFNTSEIVVLTGLGGIGKTQLAINYAKQRHEADKRVSVFWIDGSSLTHVSSSCEYLMALVRPAGPTRQDSRQNVVQTFLEWLMYQHKGQWILIIDNIEQEELFSTFALHLDYHAGIGGEFRFVPPPGRGRVLITTRNYRVIGSGDWPHVLVTAFSQNDGLRLFKRYIHEADEDQAAKLVNLLHRHPLAIAQAAAYIRSTGLSLQQYLDLFSRNERIAGQLLDEEFDEHRGPLQLPNALTRTWAITFDQIQEKSALSTDLLALLAVLHGESCPRPLLAAYNPSTNLDVALQTLLDFHLVESFADKVSMHTLIRLAARFWLDTKGQMKLFQNRALQLLHGFFPHRSSIWSTKIDPSLRELLPQVESVTHFTFDTSLELEQQAELMCAFAFHQLESLHSEDAETTFESARRIVEPSSSDTGLRISLRARSGIASVYLQQGRQPEAADIEHEVLKARISAFELFDSETISSMVNLALVYRALGKFDRAEEWYRKALGLLREQDLDSEEPTMTTKASSGLGTTLVAAGKLQQGMELQQEVVDARMAFLGKEHPDTLAAMNNLAITFYLMGDFEKGERLHTTVLETRTRVLGADHPSTLESSVNLAQVFRAKGWWNEAETLDRNTLATLKMSGSSETSLSINTMSNLATTLRNKGVIMYNKERGIAIRNGDAIAEARNLATSVVEMNERRLGEDHPDVLRSQELLASILWYDENEDEAEHMMRRVLNLRERLLGVEHPDTLTSMAAYASILALSNRLPEAMDLEEHVLEARRKVLGAEHPETVSAEENLSATRSAILAKRPTRQDEGDVRVAIYRAEIAEQFGSCMEFLETLDYHELQGPFSLRNVALNLSLLRLRLARWSTMIQFRAETTKDDLTHDKEVCVASRFQEDAIVNTLKKMGSVFRYIGDQCPYEKARVVEKEPDTPLQRLLREIDRLSDEKASTRGLWTPNERSNKKRHLGPVFRDYDILKRFVDDMNDFTDSLTQLFPDMGGSKARTQAESDARALVDWVLQFTGSLTAKERQDLVDSLNQAAADVDPAISLAMNLGRHVFGGHNYDFVKATGRLGTVIAGSYYDGPNSWGRGIYEPIVSGGRGKLNMRVGMSSRSHIGNNYGGQSMFDK